MSGEQQPEDRKVAYHEFVSLKQDITDMKSLMSRLVETMGRITIIEERQHTLTQNTGIVLERMEGITNRQHAHEVLAATNASTVARVERVEVAFRELHIENEINKARFNTFVWMVKGLWAVIGSGGVVWLFHAMTTLPVGK